MRKLKKFTSIEDDILLLREKGKTRSLSIEEILAILSEKGFALILLFLSLPFCQPLQLPGLSTPFGIAIAFIGLKMAFGKDIWLPETILAKTVTPKTIEKITEKTLWLIKKLKRLIHPRLVSICHHPLFEILNGLVIFLLGIFLSLPLPIPFSNLMAAWSIFCIGLGLLEDDGLFVAIGYVLSTITLGFLIATIFFINKIF